MLFGYFGYALIYFLLGRFYLFGLYNSFHNKTGFHSLFRFRLAVFAEILSAASRVLKVIVQLHTAVHITQTVLEILQHVVEFALYHAIGYIHARVSHDCVYHVVFVFVVRSAFCAIGQTLFYVRAVFRHSFELCGVFHEIVVKLGNFAELNRIEFYRKHGVFALEVLGVVIVGELNFEVFFLAYLHALNLLFEAGDKRFASQRKLLLFRRAAVEFHSVYAAAVIYVYGVAVFSRAVGYIHESALCFKTALYIFFHVLVGNGILRFFNGESFILPERYFGLYGYRYTENHGVGAEILYIHFGLVYGIDILVFGKSLAVCLRSASIKRFVEKHGRSVHVFYELARSFSLAKSGDIVFGFRLYISGVNFLVPLCVRHGKNELYAALLSFNFVFHCNLQKIVPNYDNTRGNFCQIVLTNYPNLVYT